MGGFLGDDSRLVDAVIVGVVRERGEHACVDMNAVATSFLTGGDGKVTSALSSCHVCAASASRATSSSSVFCSAVASQQRM